MASSLGSMLERGQILLRGELRTDVAARIKVYAAIDMQFGRELVSVGYVYGQCLNLHFDPWERGDSWRRQWAEEVETFKIPDWLEKSQCVIVGSDGSRLMPTDPRLLVHFGGILQQLLPNPRSNMVGTLAIRDAVRPKLEGFVNDQFRAWRRVVAL